MESIIIADFKIFADFNIVTLFNTTGTIQSGKVLTPVLMTGTQAFFLSLNRPDWL
jgi:hypothetical protein